MARVALWPAAAHQPCGVRDEQRGAPPPPPLFPQPTQRFDPVPLPPSPPPPSCPPPAMMQDVVEVMAPTYTMGLHVVDTSTRWTTSDVMCYLDGF